MKIVNKQLILAYKLLVLLVLHQAFLKKCIPFSIPSFSQLSRITITSLANESRVTALQRVIEGRKVFAYMHLWAANY